MFDMAGEGIRGQALRNVSMKRYTSMRVGGKVPYLFHPLDGEDVARTVRVLREKRMAFRFIGNGTNVVVADEGTDRAVIRMTRIVDAKFTKTGDGATVEVSGGFPLKKLIVRCARQGLSGIEKLYGIPGTVGGAIKMNAGSFGVSISDCLKSVTVIDEEGLLGSKEREEMSFGYRTSSLRDTDCVLTAVFRLHGGDRKGVEAEMERVWHERLSKHPMDLPSAGSIFKNVNGKPCWKYIDDAGLRGFRVGDACVSEKHPNFIVNLGRASASDIRRLIMAVKKGVYEKTGIELEEEVELWGFNDR